MKMGLLPILAALALLAAGCGGDDEALPNGSEQREETRAGATTRGDDAADDEPATGIGVLEVEMEEQDQSGQTGTATLVRIDETRTELIVDLSDPGDTEEPQRAHVHVGTCDDLGEIAHPLNTIESGRSSTRLAVGLDQLAAGGLAIDVHGSEQDAAPITSCGEIEGHDDA